MSKPVIKPRKVEAGRYEVNAIGQTFTLVKLDVPVWETPEIWSVQDERGDEVVRPSCTLRDATADLVAYLERVTA